MLSKKPDGNATYCDIYISQYVAISPSQDGENSFNVS